MKNKTKSLKTRIFALVVVVLILGASCLPCLAFDEFGATATNLGQIPIQLYSNYTVHFRDGIDSHLWDDYYWQTVISHGDDCFISYPWFPFNSVSVEEYGTIGKRIAYSMDISTFEYNYFDYIVDGFYSTQNITCGDFLIDTDVDYFDFSIELDAVHDYAVACAFTVLNGDTDKVGELQYFAFDEYNSSFISFDLGSYLAQFIGGDALIYVSAFSMQWVSVEMGDYFSYIIDWTQSESIKERNLNGARINYDGTPTVSDFISYDVISQFFENLGIDKYKDSFVNYTADFSSWLGNAVGGFLNMELFPFFSIGGILLICVAIGLVGYFLKVFMGG